MTLVSIEQSWGEAPAENWTDINQPNFPGPLDEAALEYGIHIPLLIHPHREMAYDTDINGHHSAFPSKHPWLYPNGGGHAFEDGRVMRWASVQQTSVWSHQEYHDRYDGIILPDNDHEWFLATVLRSAGYVPEQAVLLSAYKKPRITNLQQYERSYLNDPYVVNQQTRTSWKIGYYFGRYILKYGVDAVADSLDAADFLHASDPLIKQKLGYRLIRAAAETVISPIEGLYSSAQKRGNISSELPPRALRFMMIHFNNRQPDYFGALEERLKAA